MIIFLDIESGTIKAYTEKGLEELSFADADLLLAYGKDQEVVYVTNAIQTTIRDVVKTAMSQTDQATYPEEDKEFYIQSSKKGSIYISDIGLEFSGPDDCKLITPELQEVIESSPMAKQLLKRGDLKIINRIERKKAVREAQRKREKHDMLLKEEDKKLDAILVKNSEPGSAELLASGGSADEDAEFMDITNDVVNSQTAREPSEEDIRSGRLS